VKKSDIQRIAEAAKGRGQAILDRWLPGGKRQGKEYVVRNPNRDDAHAGSLSVEIASGKGGDFATGETFGDYVGLVAFADKCGMSEAAEALAEFLRIPANAAPPVQTPAAASKEKKTWRPLLPVPEGAPAPPKANPKRGRPSTIYTYTDAAGALLGYVWRHEARPPEFPRKDFYPLFFCSNEAGKCEWRFQLPPPPRPLYGLKQLADRPNVTVILHEGEKAADAGQHLAPDCVNMAWPSGSNAVDKADFGPLAGRDVLLWPDHDAPGRKAMQTAAKAVKRAGARSVKFIDTAFFEKATVSAGGRIVERLAPLPAGWDCADAEVEGWTPTLLDDLLREDGAIVESLPASADGEGEALEEKGEATGERAGPYLLDAELGLFYVETDKEGRVHQVRLCGPLSVPALGRDAEGGSWGPVLEFRDRDGLRRREVIPFKLFLGEGHDGVKQLADLGLEIASGRQTLDRLKAYIVGARTERRARLVDQTGWHGRAFVFPDGSIA
jgi:putative DNA primase/helicase